MLFEHVQNTEALQERHKNIYEQFFCQHDLVISAAIQYSLTPNFDFAHIPGWLTGGPMMSQKLPLRFYVGARRVHGEGTIQFGQSYMYRSDSDTFVDADYKVIEVEHGARRYVENLIAQKKGTMGFPSIELNILIEAPQSRGFDTSMEIMVLAALYLTYDMVDVATIQDIVTCSRADLDKQFNLFFREFFCHALKLTALCSGGYASGALSYPTFFSSGFPFVYLTEERMQRDSVHGFSVVDAESDKIFQTLRYWGFRLNELEKKITGDFPLDVLAVHLGSSIEPEELILHLKEDYYAAFNRLEDFGGRLFASVLQEESERLPHFLKNVTTQGVYWYEYSVGIAYYRLFLLEKLLALYQKRLNQGVVEDFLNALNTILDLRFPIESAPSHYVREVTQIISQHVGSSGIPFGFRSLFLSRKQGGTLLIFAPLQVLRNSAPSIVATLQEKYRDISVDFCSWRDGWGKDGIRVEQFISKGIYSKFVGRESYRLRGWNGKSGNVERVAEKNEDARKEFDILLDKMDGKIYINGEECTSRDLPTQKATIEVLVYLLEHRGEIMSNKVLPAQTYTRYRNEFQGKIVTPLNKLIEKRLGVDLGLKIHGKLLAFDVRFDPADLKIGILEKVG
ncbi:hypothetical protein A3H75_00185 [Candidatus Uhrbacteria bacterium RIFCSPLOWO2_02_FULL_51_9]|uniref:Uncharacterized protein n=1 Tax=Candidatus Uhrbacteria bacterium RIFCSPLOWO2_02_FULL_51_9 TaxID=1802410 RepID=A0A1F7VF82_9BACT|nr:MAG: hypothetical protein A3H75_00185 [Candidatus Uhrbacteria bacterium RIFCSPLOWO2_02_FULL_51_9]